MNMKKLLLPASIAAVLGAQDEALAKDYWLCAKPVNISLPQGGKIDGGGAPVMKNVIMWGFVEAVGSTTAAKLNNFAAGCNTAGQAAQVPGPLLTVPPGDSALTVHLKNAIPTSQGGEPISLIVPGQDKPSVAGSGGTGILGVGETAPGLTAATGGARDYTWSNLRPGTYAYHSASHPQLQIPMGLYGAMTRDAAPKTAYPGVSYDNEAVLVYSEVDPALYRHQNGTNAAQMQVPASDRYGAGSAVPSSINYKPEFFLINGKPFGAGDPVDATSMRNNLFVGSPPLVPGGKTLLRLVNMGLQSRALNLLGPAGEVLAEDGHPYAYRKAQYAVPLPAGGTRDVLIDTPPDPGIVPVIDRMAGLSSGDPTVTTLNPDLIAVDQASARPESGMLAKLQFGAANPAQAVADAYTIAEGQQNYVSNPAVSANDLPGDYAGHARLEAVLDSLPSQGTLAFRNYREQTYRLEPTGLFTYSHNGSENDDSFTYHLRVVAEGKGPELAGSVLAETAPATVTINITEVNDRPVATADTYLTNPALRGVAATNPYTLTVAAPGILANDTDPDLPPQTLTVNGAPRTVKTTRGQFDILADGSLTYTPWTATTVGSSGVIGATPFTATRTDSFTYQANDGQGAANSASTAVSVTMNVINTAPTRLIGSPGTTANPYVVSRSSATPSIQIRLADLFTDAENNINPASAAAFTCTKGATAPGTLAKTASDTWTYTVTPTTATGNKTLSCFATDVWSVNAANNTTMRNVIVGVVP
jgi:FtsP/CotA-like multicopper oxidase with cupredoxin domain